MVNIPRMERKESQKDVDVDVDEDVLKCSGSDSDSSNSEFEMSTDDDDDDDDDNDDDDDDEENEDSDRESTESISSYKRPFVPPVKFRDVEGSARVWQDNDSIVEFRRWVLEVISRPYDENEYKNLNAEFQARRYTDYHPELRKNLMKCGDNRRRQLAVMRGYIFWRENFREALFVPWRDETCLAVEARHLTPDNESGT